MTASFAEVIIIMATRGRCQTTNINMVRSMVLSNSTYVVFWKQNQSLQNRGEIGWEGSLPTEPSKIIGSKLGFGASCEDS